MPKVKHKEVTTQGAVWRAKTMLRALRGTRKRPEPSLGEVSMEGVAILTAWAAFVAFYGLTECDQAKAMDIAGKIVDEVTHEDAPKIEPDVPGHRRRTPHSGRRKIPSPEQSEDDHDKG